MSKPTDPTTPIGGAARAEYAAQAAVRAHDGQVQEVVALLRQDGWRLVRRLAVGQWTATFAGLGRPGGKEIVLVSPFTGADHLCTIVSWSTTGADLTATVQCFTAAGSPVDGQFSLAIVE